ncbi:MAG TPA: hypothetical protein VK449_07515 [Anaerolineales bacterium]|nr:hypothetical protein [Anaerolineales bacterium]
MPKGRSPSAPPAPAFIPPYPPSWLNRLIDWIDARRGPPWVYYSAAIVVLAILLKLGQRFGGQSAAAASSTDPIVFAFYPVYFVALMHYLDGQAKAALEAFRPALGAEESEVVRVRYELTTVPAAGAWIATALAVPLAFAFIVPLESDPLSPRVLPFEALAVVVTAITVGAALVLIYHTVRQLRSVSRLHAEARSINLLQPQPTYAFSRLTSRTAIGVAAFFYLDFLVNPPVPGNELPYFTLTFGALLVLGAAFLLPLLGMHQRLGAEKARLLAEVSGEVEDTYKDLQRLLKSRSYGQVGDIDKALSGLLRMRELVTGLSTWPWQPGTLRGLVATVGVPLLLWLIQHGLQRFVG